MQKIIVMTAYRRYGYARRVLESLARCDGIDDYTVLIHVDPGCVAVEDLARSFPLSRKEVVVNPFRLGPHVNTYGALADGFARSDYVIALEDDVVPAPDTLKFFQFVDRDYRNNPSCLGGCAYHRGMPPTEDFHKTLRIKWFTPWGWSTWKDRWEEMAAKWPLTAIEIAARGWDTVVNHEVRGDRFQVHPWLARTQNIGAEGGASCPSQAFHAAYQFNPDWAGNVEVPQGEFHNGEIGK